MFNFAHHLRNLSILYILELVLDEKIIDFTHHRIFSLYLGKDIK